MRAMVLDRIQPVQSGATPLRLADVPPPTPGEGEVVLRVAVCGVCHTELDEIEGRTPPLVVPAILGHQAIGRIERIGSRVWTLRPGDRVGVAWIFSACGACARCAAGEENLCPGFRATGRDAPGGYAEQMAAPAAFVHRIPDRFEDTVAAPLLCAGAIGYRSLRLAGLGDGARLGLTGFGASAHLVLQLVRGVQPATQVYVFARAEADRAFARRLGAVWCGEIGEAPPEALDAIIDTTPAWRPVVEALDHLRPGGRLVINAIRKEPTDRDELARIDYARHLWMEKEVKSVANVTRKDVRAFLEAAARLDLRPEVVEYPLEEANRALVDLRLSGAPGAKVLRVDG